MTIHIGILSDIPPQARTVVLVGKKSSDHLCELVRMAEFKGRAAYRIESASELQPRWFTGAKEVGVVVGADDLQNIVRAVVDRLHDFSDADQRGMLEGVAR